MTGKRLDVVCVFKAARYRLWETENEADQRPGAVSQVSIVHAQTVSGDMNANIPAVCTVCTGCFLRTFSDVI